MNRGQGIMLAVVMRDNDALKSERDELLAMARNLSDKHYSTEAQQEFERHLAAIEARTK